jgi:8-oxo-dGTP pyrophosphatase MutT (NUDIX family)
MTTTLFQYCQKLIIVSAERDRVLLAKRKGEADYDGTYSFIGGKMETTDLSLVDGMKREKNEEIGPKAVVKVFPNESYNLLFRKKDGNSMVIPHIAGIFVSGHIILNDSEYSNYLWAPIAELETLEPKISNIPQLTAWAITKLSDPGLELVEI